TGLVRSAFPGGHPGEGESRRVLLRTDCQIPSWAQSASGAALPVCRSVLYFAGSRTRHQFRRTALVALVSRRSEVSAGILAFRQKPALELLLGHPGGPYWHNKDDGAWSIPKGNVESDDLLTCAKREFTEETGLTPAGPFVTLRPLRQKSGK